MPFDDVAAFNAHHLAMKRPWSLAKVESDYAATQDELAWRSYVASVRDQS